MSEDTGLDFAAAESATEFVGSDETGTYRCTQRAFRGALNAQLAVRVEQARREGYALGKVGAPPKPCCGNDDCPERLRGEKEYRAKFEAALRGAK